MTMELVVFALGALLLLTGIVGGGLEIRELKIPPVGRIARVASTVSGVVLILMGISMVAQPALKTDFQPAATFTIYDELGQGQISEQVTVLLDGKRVGNVTVNSDFPRSQIPVTVPQAGQYSYTVEAVAHFVNPQTDKEFSYTGVGQGMIQVHDGSAFVVAGSVSGNTWVVTLMESGAG